MGEVRIDVVPWRNDDPSILRDGLKLVGRATVFDDGRALAAFVLEAADGGRWAAWFERSASTFVVAPIDGAKARPVIDGDASDAAQAFALTCAHEAFVEVERRLGVQMDSPTRLAAAIAVAEKTASAIDGFSKPLSPIASLTAVAGGVIPAATSAEATTRFAFSNPAHEAAAREAWGDGDGSIPGDDEPTKA